MTTFTTAQVDAAIEFVVEHGAIDRARTIRYTAVFEAAGMPTPQELHAGLESEVVTGFMKAFHDRCSQRGLPPLDALVVHVAGSREGRPGAGYFTVNGHVDPFGQAGSAEGVTGAWAFWQQQQEAVNRWGVDRRRGR